LLLSRIFTTSTGGWPALTACHQPWVRNKKSETATNNLYQVSAILDAQH
jgi:hypothetical protein